MCLTAKSKNLSMTFLHMETQGIDSHDWSIINSGNPIVNILSKHCITFAWKLELDWKCSQFTLILWSLLPDAEADLRIKYSICALLWRATSTTTIVWCGISSIRPHVLGRELIRRRSVRFRLFREPSVSGHGIGFSSAPSDFTFGTCKWNAIEIDGGAERKRVGIEAPH